MNKKVENFSFHEVFEEPEIQQELEPEKSRAILDQNRIRLRAALDTKFQDHKAPAARGFQLPAYVSALMLILIAILIYPAYQYFVMPTGYPQQQEIPRPPEPTLSGSAVYPARRERANEQQTIPIKFDATHSSFDLV